MKWLVLILWITISPFSRADASVDHSSPYSVLGVSDTASETEIKSAFKTLAKRFHPDHGGDKDTFSLLGNAYSLLMDRNKRAAYDRGEEVDKFQKPFNRQGTTSGGPAPSSSGPANTATAGPNLTNFSLMDILMEAPVSKGMISTGLPVSGGQPIPV